MNRKHDALLAALFLGATLVFIILMIFSSDFFNAVWARHHNLLSWYIRPFMLLPFCFFAYKRSFAGMAFSIFAMATSMAWFPAPAQPDPKAVAFLHMEYEYLHGGLSAYKLAGWISVAAVYLLLGTACYQRKLGTTSFIIVAAALLKILWSIVHGGASGWAVVPAAIVGSVVCCLVILWVARR